MRSVLITLAICVGVGAMFGWPLAWLMATLGGHGYASLLDSDVLFILGMSVCFGLLVGALICGMRAAVRAWRAGRT
jgi:hypothetical protein